LDSNGRPHSIDNIELRLHESIEFGSDDERAITKAIENSFPNAKRRLCTKHLKDNDKHYLQNRVCVNTTERSNIMSAIFGDDGLISVDDTFNFEAKSLQVKGVENYKQFVEYYDRHLKPRISSFVTEANRRINTKKLWTNNNAESMNRVMKVAVNWKPQSTPEMIQKLYENGRLSVYKPSQCITFNR
jgi:transposase-like protein